MFRVLIGSPVRINLVTGLSWFQFDIGAPFADMPPPFAKLQAARWRRERQQGDRVMWKVLATAPSHRLKYARWLGDGSTPRRAYAQPVAY